MGLERKLARGTRTRPFIPKLVGPTRIPELGARSRMIPVPGTTASISICYRGSTFQAEFFARQKAIELEELRRLAVLRKELGKEEAPELYEKDYRTPESIPALIELYREVVAHSIARLSGLIVGGRPSEDEDDAEKIANMCVAAGLSFLMKVGRIALEKQDPTEEQLFC